MEVAHCRVQHPSRRRGNERAGLLPDTTLARDADNDVRYFVQDWWFAAPLELALTFGAIGERFAWYEARSIALGFKLTGENLWSHMAWPIHIHDALNGSAALRFVRWHGALGRHVYRSLLMNSPGTVDIVKAVPTFSEVRIGGHGGIGGACDEQSFDPGVLLRSPAQDLQLRRSQVVRPDLAKTFSGRFRSMAQMCLPLP